MKVLLDGCVWGGARDALRIAGHDVESTADWLRDPGDEEILAHAFENSQVLITLDRDFGEIAVVRQRPHHGPLGEALRRSPHQTLLRDGAR